MRVETFKRNIKWGYRILDKNGNELVVSECRFGSEISAQAQGTRAMKHVKRALATY